MDKTIIIGQDAPCPYTAIEALLNETFPLDGFATNHSIMPIVHAELHVELKPLDAETAFITFDSFEVLHRFIHNLKAIADLNGSRRLATILIDLPEPEKPAEKPDEEPKKRGPGRPRKEPKPEPTEQGDLNAAEEV